MKKVRIKAQVPWIGYPGSVIQQNYAEDLLHGYLQWNIEDRTSYEVAFRQLPNPQPFVTIEWSGTVKKTFKKASVHPKGSRFRIRSNVHVAQQDVHSLTNMLKQALNASEVTFKIDQQVNKNVISDGAQTLARADLRSADVLLRLIRSYHVNAHYGEDVWQRVNEQVKSYLSLVSTSQDDVRNTKWSLRDLKFDNTFSYGEGNRIHFDGLEGIVGVFGANRSGKSSIIGTIMYSLFNTTDRGPMKNLYVCNIRKPFCYVRAIINVNGVDYAIERQTTKYSQRSGSMHAVTSLNVYKIIDGVAIDMAGEQRPDTEKVIRGLIGSSDDFLLTSLSAQGEINQFIQHGSSKRRQILSRFLDLDIFDKMYDLANKDVNNATARLRMIPEKDWNVIAEGFRQKLDELTTLINERTQTLHDSGIRLAELRAKLAQHSDVTPVSKTQVDAQRIKLTNITSQVTTTEQQLDALRKSADDLTAKVQMIKSVVENNNIDDLKRKVDALNTLEASVIALKHTHEKEATVLKQQERSLKILDDVPCDDKFPTCKFIKDAHVVKGKIEGQRERVTRSLVRLDEAADALSELKKENVHDQFVKLQKLQEMNSKLSIEISNKQTEIVRAESSLSTLLTSQDDVRTRLLALEEALKNDENVEVVSIRTEIDSLVNEVSSLDAEKMQLAAERGRILSDIQKTSEERDRREIELQNMKVHELIANAFARKGVPSVIVSSQLPVINTEIAKVLAGIVDFTVEIEVDEETDSMDVYINYGDSRRIIELASGMEKMISSIAIRTALINVSSLPKTDMFILDEGFGSLDDASVEACNRLLVSLKRYFKTVIVITHVDGVKDSADNILEITKNEKDAKVVFE